eukprot:s268_g33.t1
MNFPATAAVVQKQRGLVSPELSALVTFTCVEVIIMSRGAKSVKTDAAMGPSSHPLNEPELTQAAGLLARAVKHGQESLILRKYIHEPGHNKAIAGPADHVMKEIGEMLGKRDRDASPGPMPSAGTDDSDWSAITPGGSYVGNLGYAPPMPAQEMSSSAHPFENLKIPLPEGIDSVREWGQTVCKRRSSRVVDSPMPRWCRWQIMTRR